MHLGPYPLEKIKRVDQPTTLIIEKEVKRIPKSTYLISLFKKYIR